jgi:hypothetical protein
MRNVIDRTNVDKKVFTYITDLADKYLYDPNSPMRNEEFYIPVLEAMIASPVLNETEKIRPQARLKLAQKNRIGTKALNFTYTLASGAQGSLYQLKAEYLLLFINNPGCQACTETIEGLKNAPIINQLLQEKKLVLLSIYPDEELDEWKKHLSEFPNEWINGYDKKFTIKEEARQRFDKMLTGWARHMMELQFGEHISKINYINERCHKADILWKRMLTPAICAGIVAFIMFVCLIWVLLNIQ